MNEEEWDEFAPDYYAVQQESQARIAEDVKAYLKSERILPVETLADVAGGAGRFLTLSTETDCYELIDFSENMLEFAKYEAKKAKRTNVSFFKQSFAGFLQAKKRYELVFSAANPALTENSQFERLIDKSNKWCVVLRVVDSRDDVFSPLEERLGITSEDPHTTPRIMDQFEAYIRVQGFYFKKKEFIYYSKEEISEELMKAYYEEYANDPIFIEYLQKLFAEKEELINTTTLTYRLLVVKVR